MKNTKSTVANSQAKPRTLHGFTLQPVSAWQHYILEKINSPFMGILKIYREHGEEFQAAFKLEDKGERQKEIDRITKNVMAEIEEKIKPDVESAMETVFVFATDVEKCQDLLDEGREHFTRAARRLIGKLSPRVVSDLERACREHYAASFAKI